MKLTAKNREMSLIMEQNGNLVLYCSSGTPIWESGTKGESIGAGLIIQVFCLFDNFLAPYGLRGVCDTMNIFNI